MTMTQFYESLGAPLKNVRWSWGARRPNDGVIFLRAWKDELRTIDGAQWAMIAHHLRGGGSNLGYRERQEHIRQIESGARCLLVMCEAKDSSSRPRAIRTFDTTTVAEGRGIKTADSRTWIRVIGYKPVAEVKLPERAN